MSKKSKLQEFIIPEHPTHIVGLDLSLTGTGWAIYDAETEEVNHGVIETVKLRDCPRLDFIDTQVKRMVQVLRQPLVIIEGFSFVSYGAQFEAGGVGWMVRLSLYRMEIPYILVAPTRNKKFIASKGNVDKNIVIKEVFRRWGYDVNDDNVADAIGLMQLGRAMYGWLPSPLTEPQKEVLTELQKSCHFSPPGLAMAASQI